MTQNPLLSCYGLCDSHTTKVSSNTMLHREVVEPWQELVAAARLNGFDLSIASGFRSFERQLVLWNDKLSGVRPVVDELGQPIAINRLSPFEVMQKVMRWSAIPGASRHHWGTDIDIFDQAAMLQVHDPAFQAA